MTNKLKYFIGNWKMFGDIRSLSIITRINSFCQIFSKREKIKTVICVPNTLIYPFSKKVKKQFIDLGAQNSHFNNDYGPYTGSVNASMLKKSGAKYVILGHSENRFEGESNKLIKIKIETALNNKLNVIFCIGETYKEKLKKKTFLTLKNQIKGSLDKRFDFKKIIIAYEPVWSIGTGRLPKSNDLIKIFSFIKKEFKSSFKTNLSPPVLYGGSINSKNISLFSSIVDLDGFLIGGASQSSKKFIDIMKNYYK